MPPDVPLDGRHRMHLPRQLHKAAYLGLGRRVRTAVVLAARLRLAAALPEAAESKRVVSVEIYALPALEDTVVAEPASVLSAEAAVDAGLGVVAVWVYQWNEP